MNYVRDKTSIVTVAKIRPIIKINITCTTSETFEIVSYDNTVTIKDISYSDPSKIMKVIDPYLFNDFVNFIYNEIMPNILPKDETELTEINEDESECIAICTNCKLTFESNGYVDLCPICDLMI